LPKIHIDNQHKTIQVTANVGAWAPTSPLLCYFCRGCRHSCGTEKRGWVQMGE